MYKVLDHDSRVMTLLYFGQNPEDFFSRVGQKLNFAGFYHIAGCGAKFNNLPFGRNSLV